MAQIKRGHKHTEADPQKHDAYTKMIMCWFV